MAGEEGERVGGIYIDVGIDDENVLQRLNQIETTMASLASKEVTVKVKYVEEGSTTPKSARKGRDATVLPATLQLEKNAAKNAIKNIDPVAIPVTLSLTTDAISKLKAQIQEAFQNFSVKVNVEYGTGAGGGGPQSSVAQEEFAEATGLQGAGPRRTRTVRSSGPRPAAGPVVTPAYAIENNTKLLDKLTSELAELKRPRPAGEQQTSQRVVNTYTGEINRLRRRINVLQNTDEATLLKQLNPVPERPLIERERGFTKRDATQRKNIIPRRVAPAVVYAEAESAAEPEARQPITVPLPTRTRTGSRRMQEPTLRNAPRSEFTSVGKANLGYTVPRINVIPDELERAEAADRERRRRGNVGGMLGGRASGEPSSFAPSEPAFREFDRTPQTEVAGARGGLTPGNLTAEAPEDRLIMRGGLLIRGPRQRGPRFRQGRYARRREGPTRTVGAGPDPSRRFLEPFAPNPVTRSAEGSALGVMDPAIEEILNAQRLGEFGTRDEPMVEKLGPEGQRLALRPITEGQKAKAIKDTGRATPGTTFSQGKYRIVPFQELTKERIAALGELGPAVQQKVFGTGVETDPDEVRRGLISSKRYAPGAGVLAGPRGYQGVSQGGPAVAVRSEHDTIEGNRANQARIQQDMFDAALQKLRLENPQTAATVEALPSERQRRAFLRPFTEPYGNAVEEKAKMRAAPREFGPVGGARPQGAYLRTQAAFSRFRRGYADRTGLEGYLAEDQEVTPKTVYHAQVQKILAQYKDEFSLPQRTPRRKLPEALQSLLGAQETQVKELYGTMGPDFDRFSATGGRGRKFIPGTLEQAAAAAEPSGRATTTARPAQRTYGPGETQVAELRTILERLEGTPQSVRSPVRPGRAGTAEEQRHARSGTAMEFQGQRLGEIDVSRLLLGEVQARAARKTKPADLIRSVLTGQYSSDNPDSVRKTKRLIESLGVSTPPGTGVPAGPVGGIDISPAANEREARSRLARALVQQRGARRMLGPAYAAAGAERAEQAERGVAIEQGPILSDKPAISGDALREKVAANPMVGMAIPAAAAEPMPAAGTDTGNVRQALLRRLGGGLAARAEQLEEPIAAAPAARRRRGRRTEPTPVAMPEPVQIPLAAEPKPATGDTDAWTAMFRRRSVAEGRRAAEESAPPLGTPPTALGGGGAGPIPVHVTNFNELKAMGGVGGVKPEAKRAKLSESGEDIDPDKIREAAAKVREKQPDIDDARLAKILTKKGFEGGSVESTLGIVKATGVPRTRSRILADAEAANPGLRFQQPEREDNQKSDARIRANAAILEARSLNPTRAFQTAVAAAFAKTIGGGSKFEERVQFLTRALNSLGDFEEGLEKVNKELALNESNLQANSKAVEAAEKLPAGPERARRLETASAAEATLTARRGELTEQRAALEPQVVAAQEEATQRRRQLTTPLGVARGFGALGVGAIVGGLAFGAASQAIQAALSLIEEAATKGADALTGFAITANKVNAGLATAVRAVSGDVRGGVGGALAPSGITAGGFEAIGRAGLFNRAEATAAAQARVQESEAFRTARNLNGQQFDPALFQGTGGVLGSELLAPQPGFLERIVDDLGALQTAAQPPLTIAGGPEVGPNPGAIGNEMPQGVPGTTGFEEERGRLEAEQNRNIGLFNDYVKDLNGQLDKTSSSFDFLSGQFGEDNPLVQAMIKSGKAIGREQDARDLASKGLALTGPGGRALQGNEFGTAIQDLARAQNQVAPEVAYEQDKRAIEAAVNQTEREFQRQLTVVQPQEAALQALAAPAMPAGTSIKGRGDEQARIEKSTRETVGLQDQLNDYYKQGQAILKDTLPEELYNRIESTGQAIVATQAKITRMSAALQTHEYNNQLRIALRTQNDIAAMTGRRVKGEYDGLGYIEKQNVLLSRQSEMLQQQLAQRQINFQLAIAGFQAPGETPEERGARMADAKTQAEFAQKQLDIQKKLFGNSIKVFDIENARSFVDTVASISLLREGRQVAIDTALAEEKLQRLNKLQERNVKEAGAYLAKVEKQIGIAQSELQKLEAAYGKAINGISEDTITRFIHDISQMYKVVNTYSGGGGATVDQEGRPTSGGRGNAAGALFNTTGTTSMIVGEAGTETVAVLRNPRTASISGGGGGGGVTINFIGAVVKEEQDIQKIVQQVTEVLNRRTAMLGLR